MWSNINNGINVMKYKYRNEIMREVMIIISIMKICVIINIAKMINNGNNENNAMKIINNESNVMKWQ